MTTPSSIPFTKMQALGNDFVLLEKKDIKTPLNSAQIRWIADRRQGIGCDQVILINNSEKVAPEISFYNADGSEALACGNGTRCVAKYLGKESGTLQTPSGPSTFKQKGDSIAISLKEPVFGPPLSLLHLLLEAHPLNIGNAHLVIFTDDLDSLSLESVAPFLQASEGVNVELAQILSPTTIKAKVWERGVGITPACGSGACAVGIIALKQGLVRGPSVRIEMEGGVLEVEWEEGEVPFLTGPATYCFEGMVKLL